MKPSPYQQAIFDHVKNSNNNLVISALAGTGKCLGLDTPILMFDGTIKKVQDIKNNDILMGPDSKPRKVLSTNIGNGLLYQINPVKGDNWVCNDVHVLTVVDSVKNKISDIPLNNLLHKETGKKLGRYKNAKLFRVPINFKTTNLELDPYLLGVWIGDGNTSGPIFATPDDVIYDYLKSIAPKYSVTAKTVNQSNPKKCRMVSLTSENHKVGSRLERKNKLTKLLEEAGLGVEKNIPQKYLVNSRENRLELLAGLLDTDGYYDPSGCYQFSTKLENIKDQFLFLARSLGFAAYARHKLCSIKSTGFSAYYWVISLSGDLESIPCKLERKKANKRLQKKNVLRTGFFPKPIGLGNYYGFTLDGDGRFLLGDFTVTHNTSTIIKSLDFIPPNKKVLFVAFNKRIVTELEEKINRPNTYIKTYNGLGFGTLRGKVLDQYKIYTLITDYEKNIPEKLRLDRDTKNDVVKLIGLAKAYAFVPRGMFLHGVEIDHRDLVELADQFMIELENKELPDFDPVIVYAYNLLKKSIEIENIIDFNDQIYFPVIHNKRFLHYDYVFNDELQDISYCQRMMMLNVTNGSRFVGVGDQNQCQPPNTLVLLTGGEQKKISDLKVGDLVATYDRSSAYFVGTHSQGKRVLNIKSRQYIGQMFRFTVDEKIVDATPNHKWVTRFKNRDTKWNIVYIMQQGGRFRVGWCQLFNKGSLLHTTHRARIEKADRYWILKTFDNKTDASIYESFINCRFGIPTIPFEPVNNATHITRNAIDNFFESIQPFFSINQIIDCLDEHGKKYAHPFWDRERDLHSHKTTIMQTQSCNLFPELMMLPHYKNSKNVCWANFDKTEYFYDGVVYSLDIEKHHTYVANGVATCNSIYQFRGADHNSMREVISAFNTDVLGLPINYRCGKSIIAEAQKFVPEIKAFDGAGEGVVDYIRDLPGNLGNGDMILHPYNAPLVETCYELMNNGVRAKILGKDIGAGILRIIQKAKAKNRKDLIEKMQQAIVFESQKEHPQTDRYDAVIMFAKNCALTEIEDIKNEVSLFFTDDYNDKAVTLSTIHKSKGLESNRVFILPFRKDYVAKNLQYVAVTRAKRELYFLEGSF